MLNKIIYYSLHNRLVVLICSLLLMIAGTYTAFHTDVDVFPDLNAPTVVIMTEANGRTSGYFSGRDGCEWCDGCAPCPFVFYDRFFCRVG